MTTNHYKRGITALEILIVLAVLAGMFAIVIPQFSKMKENQVLKNAVGDILSSLDKARSETLASVNSSSYGVHFQSDGVIIFKGVDFSTRDTSKDEMINIILPANISNIALGTGISDVYFARLTGTPSHIGTIMVSTTSYSKTITISASGIASVN